MEMTGQTRIPAPRERVWAALNDPEVLKACIPGCQSLEMLSPTEMSARVTAKIGPVKAAFAGRVSLQDVVPPESYRILGEGQGGVAGFAKGGATVRLTPEPDGATLVDGRADAQVGGRLAQLGGRLIDSTARMMADQFFARFAEIAAGAPAVAVPPETTPQAGVAPIDAVTQAGETVPGPEATAWTPEPAAPLGGATQPTGYAPIAGSAAPPPADAIPAAAGPAPSGREIPRWVWLALAVVLIVLVVAAIR